MKVKNVVRKLVVGGLLLLGTSVGWAEDTDLFFPADSGVEDSANVLVILDNSSGWLASENDGMPVMAAVKSAMADVLRGLRPGSVRVGMLLYTPPQDGRARDRGAYVRAALRPMTEAAAELYAQQIEHLAVEEDVGVGGHSALALAEAYFYYSGGAALAGKGRDKADFPGKSGWVDAQTGQPDCQQRAGNRCVWAGPGSAADAAVWALEGNALDKLDSLTYRPPGSANSCGSNTIILVSSGPNPDVQSASRRARDLLQQMGGDVTPIELPYASAMRNFADEWSRFMAVGPLRVTTHAIDINPGEGDEDRAWTALLRSIAAVSSGNYLATDASAPGIRGAVEAAFAQALTVDASYTSVAMPASAFLRGTFLNQVYTAQFRPDGSGRPRWLGNLKQYQLGIEPGIGETELRVLDADGRNAIEPIDGRVRACARSFWTPGSPDAYWRFLALGEQHGDCPDGLSESNFPDGSRVEKGGQAYVGRGGRAYTDAAADARWVTTATAELCGGETGVACAMMDLSVANPALTAAGLGASNANERDRYILWARGADTEDEDGDANTDEYRPSLHGDVIHSRPLAIDYATRPDEESVVVFYGSNDGLLRAVNGNRTLPQQGVEVAPPVPAGGEFWAFMPPEYHRKIGVAISNIAGDGAGGRLKIYGPDGPLTSWQDPSGRRYLVMTMRRGGGSVYGFDITDPARPLMLWRQGCHTTANGARECAPGWADVGQTWSPVQLAWQDPDAAPLLIMGGGYDPCEDRDIPDLLANHDCDSSTRANGIYILDSATGAVLNNFGTERAVPGRVTVVPAADSERGTSYAYAADAGGNLYRLSGPAGEPIGQTAPAHWVLTRIAELGCGDKSDSLCSANRKFLSGPDVVRIPGTERYAVMIGSGDREKPTAASIAAMSVENYFYALVDAPGSTEWLDSMLATCNRATLCGDALTRVSIGSPVLSGHDGDARGWRMKLRHGEQVVSAALTIANKVYFNTHLPGAAAANVCRHGMGVATSYQLDYRDGSGTVTVMPAGGLLPTPVAGKVVLDDGRLSPFCIGCGGEKSAIGSGGITLPAYLPRPKVRVYRSVER